MVLSRYEKRLQEASVARRRNRRIRQTLKGRKDLEGNTRDVREAKNAIKAAFLEILANHEPGDIITPSELLKKADVSLVNIAQRNKYRISYDFLSGKKNGGGEYPIAYLEGDKYIFLPFSISRFGFELVENLRCLYYQWHYTRFHREFAVTRKQLAFGKITRNHASILTGYFEDMPYRPAILKQDKGRIVLSDFGQFLIDIPNGDALLLPKSRIDFLICYGRKKT